MARPMPRLPPVTTTLCIVPRQFAGRRNLERGYEFDHGRHLVRRQLGPAIGQNLIADVVAPAYIAAIGENDIGDHDRTGDRALARSGAGHPHLRMPVDDGLDFLRMNLEAANVDNAAAPADEVISLAAQLDHVAGVDEAVAVSEFGGVLADIGVRRPGRPDPQRSVLDL